MKIPHLLIAGLLSTAVVAQADDARNVISAGVAQHCGVMLGGIGSGYMELWPDGCFHDWGNFNRGRWGYREDFIAKDKQDRAALADMNEQALQFFVQAKAPKGESITRRLSTDGELMNPYSYTTWLQNVESITYDYTYPGAKLQYVDSTLPVSVSASFFSPIIPHDLQTSGTPGWYAVFTIKNTSKETQEVSLASYLRNPLVRGGDSASRSADIRKLRTSVGTEQDTTYLTMRTDADVPFKTTTGNMCLSMSGGKPSWIAMDFGDFLIGRTLNIKPWNQRYETAFKDFRFSGTLPNSGEVACPTKIGVLQIGGSAGVNMQVMPTQQAKEGGVNNEQITKLTDDQVAEIIAQARKIPSLQSIVRQGEAVDPDLLIPSKKGRDLVNAIAQAVSQYAGADGRAVSWGDGMLCSSVTLKPGEEKQVRVVLSWFFPNHPSPYDARNMGHMYANWFKDAEEVNKFLVKNAADFGDKVAAFRDALKVNTLPPVLMSSVAIQLNTLICSTWWTQDDRMGVWEGLGTIGQNTVDVSYQGSHPITTLFPQFEKNWTKLATTYQNDDTGRLYHSLPNDFDKGPKKNGYGYVDVNCHFVLEMTRDYLWFGNKAYLDFYYPHVMNGIKAFAELDSDGDGLPDQHTNSNTYDTWDLQGTPSYLSSIWIAALRGGIRMATDAGDTANATKWQGMLDKALKTFNEKLWNGEYYSLWVEGDLRDEACMTDQLSGEMYTKLIGLGNGVPVDRARKALEAVYKYNFTPEQGLWNGTYPPGHQPHMPTYENVQGEGNWTGIEYAAAAAMLDQGMVKEGLSIIDAVQRRYERAGRLFNHEECGPHYYRPMSIWATFLAATGFKVDAPRGILTIAPPIKQDSLLAPWFSATGFGKYTRTDHTFDLACGEGETTFRELRLNITGAKGATLDGKAVACESKVENGLTVLRFTNPVTLKKGQTLAIR